MQTKSTQKPTKAPQRSGTTPRQRGRIVAPRRRRWPWAVAAVAAVLLIGAGLWYGQRTSVPGEIAGVQTFAGLSQDHQDGELTYEQTPPVGGAHNAVWQNCGVYEQPIANQHAVHSLEHGAVWVTYSPDLPADQVEQLQTLLRGRGYTLLSPYEGLPSPIVASAWGVQLQLEDAGDERLTQFLAKYVQGDQTPEPNAACIGGISVAAGN